MSYYRRDSSGSDDDDDYQKKNKQPYYAQRFGRGGQRGGYQARGYQRQVYPQKGYQQRYQRQGNPHQHGMNKYKANAQRHPQYRNEQRNDSDNDSASWRGNRHQDLFGRSKYNDPNDDDDSNDYKQESDDDDEDYDSQQSADMDYSRPDAEERYCKVHAYDMEKPTNRLKYSNFLELYDDFDHDELDATEVYQCIPNKWICSKENGPPQLRGKNVRNLFEKWTKQLNFEKACVKIWTCSSPVYTTLNESLYEDNDGNLDELMPLISGMNAYLKSHPTRQRKTCYRGSSMTHKQFARYKVGNIYRAPAFGAITTDYGLSQKFVKMNKNPNAAEVTITFEVEKNCHNAAAVADLNVYGEDEVLTQPYTAFKVVQKGRKSVRCILLNNRNESTDVPSIFI